MCTSAFAHGATPISWQGLGRRQGKCGALREGASAFAFALPHPALSGAGHGATTARPLPHSGADTPGSGRRANDILYIRVRRREGEHVLHRAASNDVDNFSVDNPLWITAAAGGRSLRGRRRRPCGGSVNDGAEVQTRTGRVRKSSWAMGARRGRLSAPWSRFHGVGRADVYIIIRVRACCCGECALNPPTSPPIPRRRLPLPPRTATRPARALPLPHAAPTHARRLRDARPQCAMHSPLPSQPIPRRRPSLAPHSDTPSQTLLLAHAAQMHARRPHDPFPAEELRPSPQRHAASPSVPLRAQKKRHRTVDVRCRMSRSTVVAVGHWGW